jgi:hypothetical protein
VQRLVRPFNVSATSSSSHMLAVAIAFSSIPSILTHFAFQMARLICQHAREPWKRCWHTRMQQTIS